MNLRWVNCLVVALVAWVRAGAEGVSTSVTTAATPVATVSPPPPPPPPPRPPAACASGGATQLTVLSRQNVTGHWLGDAWVERAAHPGRPLGPLQVHISHERRRCGPSTSVVMHVKLEGSPDPLEEDYHFYKGFGYYKAHFEKATWLEARKICENEGAHLVIINSPEEAELISKMVPTLGGVSLIGLHDMFSEGHFVTVFGEPLESTGYIKWAPTEPNGNRVENCVNIYASGSMNDLACNKSKYSFVCEFPSA